MSLSATDWRRVLEHPRTRMMGCISSQCFLMQKSYSNTCSVYLCKRCSLLNQGMCPAAVAGQTEEDRLRLRPATHTHTNAGNPAGCTSCSTASPQLFSAALSWCEGDAGMPTNAATRNAACVTGGGITIWPEHYFKVCTDCHKKKRKYKICICKW